MRGSSMREAGFYQANQTTEEIQDVKQNLQKMQEVHRSILAAIEC